MRVKLLIFIFVFIAASLAAFPIEAFKVTAASASVSEPEFRGSCPHRFNFSGRITANREGTVRYRWLRSDGSAGAVETLAFTTAGTRTVATYWELGGTMGTYPDHWQRIEVTAPNSLLSNKAVFELECLPRMRMERKISRVSGRIIAGGPHVEWLNGLQLKVKLMSGTRVASSQTVAFGGGGIVDYSLVVYNAPGGYRVTVEPVHPTNPDLYYLCFDHVDPASILVELTEAAPEALNRNFDLTWSWRHLDMGQVAFASPCW